MSDPNTRFQTVNVEQIMAQIRARIRERRGPDRADAQIRELAAARLAGLVGSHGAQAELLEKLRRGAATAPDAAPIDHSSVYGRPGPLRWIRRMLSPILALFLSPTALTHALGQQRDDLARQEQSSAALLGVIENLVLEMTRLEVEVKKLEMRVESQATRLEFAERRARAVEGMVRYGSEQAPEPQVPQGRPPREPVGSPQGRPPREPAGPAQGRPPREPVVSAQAPTGGQPQGGRDADPAGGDAAKRRRRRRRGRRGGTNRMPGEGGAAGAEQATGSDVGSEPGEPGPGADPDDGPAPEPQREEPQREEPRHDEPRHDEPPTPPDHDGQ